MLGRRPTVIACNQSLSEQIRDELANRLERPIDHATYEDCRNRLAWHDDGPLLLVAGADGEAEQVAKVVCESRLRRAPIPIAIVEADGFADSDILAELERFVATRLRWPEAASALAAFVGTNPSPDQDDEPLAAVIASRLQVLTPSLTVLAG